MAWWDWLQFAPILVLLPLGFSVGGFVERAHFRRLAVREDALQDVFVTDLRVPPPGCEAKPCGLVFGEVVIASDYFKTFAAGIRKIIGGELRAYDTLMQRARREALVRMKESARRMGANHVMNVRLATSNIGSIRRRGAAAMVEMYTYGTAVFVENKPPSS